MDYSKFVTAVLEDNKEHLNELSVVISKVLIKFLLVRLDASLEDAKDSAQSAILYSIEKIKNNELNNPDLIIHYLFKTAKNNYLKQQNKNKEMNYKEVPDHYSEQGDQLTNLLDAERRSVLKVCISQLKPKQHNYISYWFNNPGSDTSLVAEHFNISVNNAWIKKHRIIKMLKECVEKKLNK